jgi:protein subunit release factor B
MEKEIKYAITKKDLEMTWFSGSGGGGQHRNKHPNCCRIRHPETGVIVTGQSHKERPANQKEALQNLARNFKIRHFLEQKLNEIETGMTIHEAAEKFVEEMMRPENFKEVESEKDWKLMIRGKTKEVINGVEIWT